MKLKGTVRGQTIVFDHPIDLPEGHRVEADVNPIKTPQTSKNTASSPFRPPTTWSPTTSSTTSGTNWASEP